MIRRSDSRRLDLDTDADILLPAIQLRNDRLFVAVLGFGLLAFAALATWDLHNYLSLANIITESRHVLPLPGIADPDRRLLANYLDRAQDIYVNSRMVLLSSLSVGLALGAVVILMVERYFLERRATEHNLLQAFLAMAESIEERDSGTGRHCEEVRRLSVTLGRRLGLNRNRLRQLAMGAHLHDLGKIAVPDRILLKPGSLDEEERSVMHGHAEIGARIIGRIQRFQEAAEIVRHHHEHFDGSGYPDGLRGSDIPLGARVVAVVDAYLAMTHDRPYHKAIPPTAAVGELRAESGTQFDPHLVREFLALLAQRDGDQSSSGS